MRRSKKLHPIRLLRILICSLTGVLFLFAYLLLINPSDHPALAEGSSLFVTPFGAGDCSQADPCDLQIALSTAIDGDEILLAGGHYTGTGGAVITITKSLALYGGWDGAASGEPAVDPAAFPVEVDGEAARRGIYIGEAVTVTLQGFSVTHGMSASDGAGLHAHDAALTLREMTFADNLVDIYDTPGSIVHGGGVYVSSGSLLVERCTFRANSAWASTYSTGGGLSIAGTSNVGVYDSLFMENDAWLGSGLYFAGVNGIPTTFTLRDSAFSDNGRGLSGDRAYGGYAGAIEIYNAEIVLEGNRVEGNRASNDRGAVSISNSIARLDGNLINNNQSGRVAGLSLAASTIFTATNNIIAGNESTNPAVDSPAIRVAHSQGRFVHNTVASNTSGQGYLLGDSSSAILTNTILVSHTLGISVSAGSTATLQATLWGSGDWANGTDWAGSGSILTGTVNIWGDPVFVAPPDGDYHITPASAALDAGLNAGIDLDFDGNTRPIGVGFDIGADELGWHLYLPNILKSSP